MRDTFTFKRRRRGTVYPSSCSRGPLIRYLSRCVYSLTRCRFIAETTFKSEMKYWLSVYIFADNCKPLTIFAAVSNDVISARSDNSLISLELNRETKRDEKLHRDFEIKRPSKSLQVWFYVLWLINKKSASHWLDHSATLLNS